MKMIRFFVNILFLILALPMWLLMIFLFLYTKIIHPIVKYFTKKQHIKTYQWFQNLHNCFVDLIDNY